MSLNPRLNEALGGDVLLQALQEPLCVLLVAVHGLHLTFAHHLAIYTSGESVVCGGAGVLCQPRDLAGVLLAACNHVLSRNCDTL